MAVTEFADSEFADSEFPDSEYRDSEYRDSEHQQIGDGLLAGYTTSDNDEVVAPGGRVRRAYRPILDRLASLGPEGLARQAEEIDRRRGEQGIVFAADLDGETVEQPFPFDPVPRLLERREWDEISAGTRQRHRALNAFLRDVYGPGRIMADGVMPRQVVESCPGYRPEVEHPAGDGPPPVVVAGFDLLLGPDGWVVLEDNLRVPSGLGYAIANRRTTIAALPLLKDRLGEGVLDPEAAPAVLLRQLRSARPPRCPRDEPAVVLLSDGPDNTAWFEHRMLAREMGVAVVTPDAVVADGDGVAVVLDGVREPVDVLYRRVDEEDLGELEAVLRRAGSAGTVTVANALGNGVADDKAIYSYVPSMIRYYLNEEPLLAEVETFVLADPAHYQQVRGRLSELVVKPVDGYGGQGVVFGSTLDAAGLAELEAEVEAAPYRFVAQRPVLFSTHPTVVEGRLEPRHVDLRVFTLAGADQQSGHDVEAAPSPLTRVALGRGSLVVNSSRGGGSKDTWVIG